MIKQYFENRKQLLNEAKEQVRGIYNRYKKELSYIRPYDPSQTYKFPNGNIVKFWRSSDPSDIRLRAEIFNVKNHIYFMMILT
jgi:hypothetical protein